MASLGYRVPAEPRGRSGPRTSSSILRQIEGKPEEKLVSYLLLRTMKLARYHEENLGHFGLATEMYAHFTSPIRRYPDLVVHRALRALRPGPRRRARGVAQAEALPEMGLHLSEMERRATEAERELIEWKKVRFMADKLGEVFSGYVTGVQAFGLFVELEEIYVQGLVHVSSMTDDYYRFNEKAHLLKGENTAQGLPPGRPGEVQVVAGRPRAAADRLRAGGRARARPRRGGPRRRRAAAPRHSARRARAQACRGASAAGRGKRGRRPRRHRR